MEEVRVGETRKRKENDWEGGEEEMGREECWKGVRFVVFVWWGVCRVFVMFRGCVESQSGNLKLRLEI